MFSSGKTEIEHLIVESQKKNGKNFLKVSVYTINVTRNLVSST